MTPRSTYRLQLHGDFTFRDAAAVSGYIADLGVSHVYASPSLQAVPGSMHGYDVADPTRLDDERGGDEGFAVLRRALDDVGLGLVMDIVPNHVGLALPDNPWWWSVLREGPDSPYADHFDIAWSPGPSGRPQVVWPELGDDLDEVLAGGELTGDVRSGELVLRYHDHVLPTRPGTAADHGLPADPAAAAAAVDEDPGLLRRVLDDQHWRLVHWQRANQELVHRRFFDITTLGGVRVEDPAVFADVHGRVLELVADGAVDGLRVDHPDGLWDPTGYARDLRAAAPDAWIVFEKILEAGESLRADWPIDGTVGYSFLNAVLGLFVDPRSEVPLTALYDELLGDRRDPVSVANTARREALDLFDTELDRLTDLLLAVAGADGADRAAARRTLEELALGFPVYRTYVVPGRDEIAPSDHAVLDEAVATARARLRGDDALLDVLDDALRLRRRGGTATELVHRFQQLTGPVMAKGVEDTTFYRYLRFTAVNEVGGHPQHLGTSPGQFHAANAARAADWPGAMTTTSTHDTKRAEDVRARLATLSEVPDLWIRTVQRLEEVTAGHVGRHGPNARHRYLLWQTLVGAWPIGPERLVDYLVKAAREGKRATSWLDPDEGYEADLEAFARAVLDDVVVGDVLRPLLEVVVPAGRSTSLSQSLLRLTSPGVPDTYQGCELWDLSLVDPDNRRPVDYDRRRELLAWLDRDPGPTPEEILARADEGAPKLHVVSRALRLRRDRPAAFAPGTGGDYLPITTTGGGVRLRGPRADHVVAFERGPGVVVVAPRLVVGLSGGTGRFGDWDWQDTVLRLTGDSPGPLHDVLTGTVHEGSEVGLADLLGRFPVALLTTPPREADE